MLFGGTSPTASAKSEISGRDSRARARLNYAVEGAVDLNQLSRNIFVSMRRDRGSRKSDTTGRYRATNVAPDATENDSRYTGKSYETIMSDLSGNIAATELSNW